MISFDLMNTLNQLASHKQFCHMQNHDRPSLLGHSPCSSNSYDIGQGSYVTACPLVNSASALSQPIPGGVKEDVEHSTPKTSGEVARDLTVHHGRDEETLSPEIWAQDHSFMANQHEVAISQ